MTQPSPLATPAPWNAIVGGYVDELLPLFSEYARDALALAQLPPRAHVLDVAAGPGTLALLAASQAERVVAVDFAETMLEQLRQSAAEQGLTNVEARQADGQALPYDDASFDAAFSMFGLIFFPDRAAGLRELLRVLRPGGRAVISAWSSIAQVPLLDAFYGALRELIPDSPPPAKAPLSEEADFRQELAAAGFHDIAIHHVAHTHTAASPRSFWESQARSSVRVALLEQRLEPAEWARMADGVVERLEQRFGPGPLRVQYPALLGVGVR